MTATPSATATAEPSAIPTATPGANPLASPFPTPLPSTSSDPGPASPVKAWATQVAKVVRKAKAGRTVKVRLAAPTSGRLEVRVLDRAGRTLARGSVSFARAGGRTLTLKPVRRGARAAVRVRWVPKSGRAQTLRRGL